MFMDDVECGNLRTVKPRYSAFQGTIHIYTLKRGHAIAGIGFTIA